MKVLHVIHGYFPESGGGSEAYTRDVIAEQRRRGMAPTLLTGSMVPWPQCGTEEIDVGGTRVIRLHRDDHYFDLHSKAYHPGVERLVREVLATERPDVLHLHQWIRLTSNLVEIADELGIPTVITLHDLYTSCPRAFRVRPDDRPCDRPLSVDSCADCVPRYGHESPEEIAESIELHRAQFQGELARARAVIVASTATAEMIGRTTGFPVERFTVLPLAYRRRFTAAPTAPALPGDGEPFRFAYWGNLTRRKGAQVLLEAFATMIDRGVPRPAELHLYGGVDTDELRFELDGLAAGRPVVFHGRYDYEQLAATGAHMAVFPMVCFETFGFVYDEACELGLPSIVTGIGAIPQRAGDAALVVPPGDAGALAEAMASVLRRPQLRDELATRIPALPPRPGEHVDALCRIYDEARTADRLADIESVDPLRRAAFLVTQRESALRALHPGSGPR